MELKSAVTIAKQYIRALYEDEPIARLGLEEAVLDPQSNHWLITLSFYRNWNDEASTNPFELAQKVRRFFKVVEISNDITGEVLAVRDRET
jgi:hypothetical protein